MRSLIWVPIIHSPEDLGGLRESVQSNYIGRGGQAKWDAYPKSVDDLWRQIRITIDGLNLESIMFICREIHNAAVQEIASEADAIRAELSQLYLALEAGSLAEEAFDARESDLLDRLDEIEERGVLEGAEGDDEDDEDDNDDDEDDGANEGEELATEPCPVGNDMKD
jgi:Gas vesicle protein G